MSTVPTPTTSKTDLSPFHMTIAATWNTSGSAGTSGVLNATFGATARFNAAGPLNITTSPSQIFGTFNIFDTNDRIVVIIPSSTVRWRLADSSGATGVLFGGTTLPVVLPLASSVQTPSVWAYTVTAASTMEIVRLVF